MKRFPTPGLPAEGYRLGRSAFADMNPVVHEV